MQAWSILTHPPASISEIAFSIIKCPPSAHLWLDNRSSLKATLQVAESDLRLLQGTDVRGASLSDRGAAPDRRGLVVR
jgi:hypothetical protein